MRYDHVNWIASSIKKLTSHNINIETTKSYQLGYTYTMPIQNEHQSAKNF